MKSESSVALIDYDGTIRPGVLIIPLAQSQEAEGLLIPGTARRLEADYAQYAKGQIRYEYFVTNLLEDWAAGLTGHNRRQVSQHAKHFLATDQLYDFVPGMIRLLGATHQTYLVTAEPLFVAEIVAQQIGVNGLRSSIFETNVSGNFTGNIDLSLAKTRNKATAVSSLIEKYGFARSIAVGDSMGDVDMLSLVQNPICLNPRPELAALARQNHWRQATPDNIIAVLKSVLNPGQ